MQITIGRYKKKCTAISNIILVDDVIDDRRRSNSSIFCSLAYNILKTYRDTKNTKTRVWKKPYFPVIDEWIAYSNIGFVVYDEERRLHDGRRGKGYDVRIYYEWRRSKSVPEPREKYKIIIITTLSRLYPMVPLEHDRAHPCN